MTEIVLADDHEIVRQGLRMILESEPDLKIVGEAGTGEEALRLVKKLKPDVLVLDLMMPGLSGLEVARQVTREHPGTHTVILSMHSSERYVVEALESGAAAYVLKRSGASELVQAVHAALAGERFLSPPLTQRAIHSYVVRAAEARLDDAYETLTGREGEILPMLAQGLTTGEIAGRLAISPRTAETHRTNILRKLGQRNQTELVHYALRRGIVTLEE